MSRVGNKEIIIPAGVEVKVEGSLITVKGAKGTLTQLIDDARITVEIKGVTLKVKRAEETGVVKAKHGLYRALIANMITGVSNGYVKSLLVNGVGYKTAVAGNKLTLNIGFSHPVVVEAPEGIKIEVPANNEIAISGIDKAAVGQFAASIRAIKKPEPYHGYGIQYKDEVVERKEGKAAGKK
ncbi:MAG: 50S ribosomal protein L6 [Bacillota bacterium]